MSASPRDEPSGEAREDPVLLLQRDHTLLDLLTAGMREAADLLDREEPIAPEHIQQGVELHRAFLVDVHQRKEELVERAVEGLAPEEAKRMVATCRVEHPKAAAAEEAIAQELGRFRRPEPDARRVLARLLRREADRITEHHRWEEETMYEELTELLPESARRELAVRLREFAGPAAAAEARLKSWSSHLHPSSD